MKRCLYGFLCILGMQYKYGKSKSNLVVSKPKEARADLWLSIVSEAESRGRRRPRRPGPPREDNVVVDEPYKDLKVEAVDFLIGENGKEHHTEQYDLTGSSAKLVLRRGSPFSVKIRFSRKFNLKEDNLRFTLSAGEDPQHGDGTLVNFSLTEKDLRGKWSAEMTEEKENEIKVKIQIPSECLVCQWDFKVEILEQKDGKPIVHLNKKIFPEEIYIIFNPWNKADTVYLEDENLRKEYVLNDDGAIWIGDSTRKRAWFFGQFEKNILDCTMYLLDYGDESMKTRGNSVLVSRKLSAVGNAPDEGGLLVGNWSGNYSGGTNPSKWVGSVKIMQQFWEKKFPVNFGQCWVFSGVTTTMCRAIGIPCRSVTNFSSAHDTNGSITIDRTFDIDGNSINVSGRKEGISNNSRNFHVWNEVWMRRPDIPNGKYDGWQAIDSTPQELSNNIFQCGPMPVAAIKEGHLSFNYDGPFIFAEVNADVVTWVIGRDGQKYLSDIDRQR
ncbi:hypothetical protein FSP39_012656 [Pinctada imbricata]|uniref:Transglutaminase-like domain-containing protein n=1 Tax=Pinctada imbricata TaxID=66713 RepID=A0AA88XIX3_PINIB|nr:hypothetical protein FSP39_012656 [Pinctada imbricata]